ncbi:threonine/serine ThrE exporter family protein [Haloechinothrix salitolerans]|uniref:Threonine/serine exporter ThrE family protein n=1 Tax=Haloechinothrix salitolerans TaxID=926830 RepID=A0ABW2BVC5_9PSEU
MKLSPRRRGAHVKRRAWRVLEAPSEAPTDDTGKATNGRKGPLRAWGILEAPMREQPSPVTDMAMGPELPDDATVHFALELALRIGEVQMATGAGASDVTATILAVTSALGLPQCEVDVIYTSITVTCHRGTEMAPVTAVRVVRTRSLDYSRLTAVEELVKQITRGQISAEDAYAELRRVNAAPHPYPRWVATLALGGMAASVTVFINGDPATAALAFFVSALIDRVGRVLNRYALPMFFQQAVGGLIATLITMAAVSSDIGAFRSPSLVAAAAITVLLSGLGTVTAVQDAITGYNVTAAGRSMEVALMSAGLITGIVIALQIAIALGLERTPLPDLPAPKAIALPVMMLAGAGTAGFFALASYSRVRPLLVAAVAGMVGAGTYGAIRFSGGDAIMATAIAATFVGFSGGLLARRLRVTPLVVAVSGITPLLPGLSTYRGLYELAVSPAGDITTLMKAIALGLALAAGVVLGEYLAQPVRTRLGRLERKLVGPRMAGPLKPAKRRLD